MKKLIIVTIFLILGGAIYQTKNSHLYLPIKFSSGNPEVKITKSNTETTTPKIDVIATSTPVIKPADSIKPNTTTPKIVTSSEFVSLPVPFYWEIPDGVWVPPWSGACEEASIVAAEGYYLKKPKEIIKREEAKETMFPLFGIEKTLFGYNIDTDAKETARLINDYASFDAVVIDNPKLEEIKNELREGRPVISMHYGLDLENPRHRFRAGGSSYHVMTLVGFDDKKQEFLVNDSELSDGIDLRYKYDIILTTLHDFDHTTKKANGPARVLFTRPKVIARSADTGELFLIRSNTKHPILSAEVLKNHRWSETLIQEMEQGELDSLKTGETISK